MAQSGTQDAIRQFRNCPGHSGRLATLESIEIRSMAVLLCSVWVCILFFEKIWETLFLQIA